MRLVLSPHPDDAALSLGGYIHQLASQGERVVILTTMGGDPTPPVPDTPLVRELHARWGRGEAPAAVRRDEDRAAAKVLGAEVEFLDIPDCVYRRGRDGIALYPTEESIFGPLHEEDETQDNIPEQLVTLAQQATDVYAPMGIGGHVDHQAVLMWAAGLTFVHRPVKIWLYEDCPYAEDPDAVLAAQEWVPGVISLRQLQLTEADVRAKIDAVACYPSQISTFWQSPDMMSARVRAHLTRSGTQPPHERCWEFEGYW